LQYIKQQPYSLWEKIKIARPVLFFTITEPILKNKKTNTSLASGIQRIVKLGIWESVLTRHSGVF